MFPHVLYYLLLLYSPYTCKDKSLILSYGVPACSPYPLYIHVYIYTRTYRRKKRETRVDGASTQGKVCVSLFPGLVGGLPILRSSTPSTIAATSRSFVATCSSRRSKWKKQKTRGKSKQFREPHDCRRKHSRHHNQKVTTHIVQPSL